MAFILDNWHSELHRRIEILYDKRFSIASHRLLMATPLVCMEIHANLGAVTTVAKGRLIVG